MENQTDRIVELYQGGKGIKAIARELNLSPSLVRRTLLRQGIYLGAARTREAREASEQVIFFSITGREEVTRAVTIDLPTLEQWTARGVGVERIDDGWRLSFTPGFDAEVFSPPLEGE